MRLEQPALNFSRQLGRSTRCPMALDRRNPPHWIFQLYWSFDQPIPRAHFILMRDKVLPLGHISHSLRLRNQIRL